MIKVENASFYYKHNKPLFQDLNLQLGRFNTLAILGANGVGKTTFLRCLMRFLQLKSGRILLRSIDCSSMKQQEFWQTVSYVPQAKGSVFGYSVLEMVTMGRSPYIGLGRQPKREDYDSAAEMLEELGISHLSEQSCNNLSGGQLQMVLIARALVKRPELLIMDEPETGLDMKNQLLVLDIIQSLTRRRQLTIIINTHFPAHAMRVADKVLLLGKGCHIYDDTDKVINEVNIRDYFGVNTAIVDSGSVPGIIPIDIANNIPKELVNEQNAI